MPSKVLLKKMKDAERIEKIDEHPTPFVNHDHSLTFPEKLMIMLLDDRNSNAIVWNHDGTQFSIRNRELLCSDVLPHYFRSTSEIKYGSFARKLSRWHFTRTSSGLDTRIYFHDLFLRDKPSLCSQMTCKSKTEDTEPVDSRVPHCKKESIDPQTISPSKSDNVHVPEDIDSANLPTICSTKYMYSLLFSGCKINRMGKLAVFAQLRHDASILYDYPTKDISSHLQTEKFFSDSASTTSAATTQAVVDAALVAMQRCDDAVTKTERCKALAKTSNLLLHERDRISHCEGALCGGTEFGSSDLLRALILSAKAKEKFWSSLPLGILRSNTGNNDLSTNGEKHTPIELETDSTSKKADVIPDDIDERKVINSECAKENTGDYSMVKRPLSERDIEQYVQSPKRTKPNQ